jgi:hypothetical protein
MAPRTLVGIDQGTLEERAIRTVPSGRYDEFIARAMAGQRERA